MADIVIKTLGPLWTLDEVKTDLNVEDEASDTLISAYMEAAERAMLRFCNISLVPYGEEAVFKVAGFFLVRSFYDERQEDPADDVPAPVRKLLWPYRRGLGA